MSIKIEGNKFRDTLLDTIEITNPKGDVEISDNEIERTGGTAIKIKHEYNEAAVDKFYSEIEPHLQSLTEQQKEELLSAVKTLKSKDEKNNGVAIELLRNIAKNLPASIIANIISSFIV